MRPGKVVIFIVAVMAGLAGLCVLLPGVTFGGYTVHWPTLAEVLETNDREQAGSEQLEEIPFADTDTIILMDSVAIQDSIQRKEEPINIVHVPIDSITDSRMFMRRFYAALREGESERGRIRVMHYGDSQIEEDRMSQQIREVLQGRFGGSGAGLVPLVQTIPSLTVRQRIWMNGKQTVPAKGPRRYLVYGPKRDQRTDGRYGPMGQVAVMSDSLASGSDSVMAVCTPLIESARYSRWKIFADSSIRYSISGDTVVLSGEGAVYGLSQESEKGVIVDNIPMRGCLGLVFTKIDSTQLATFYREQNVRLIILQFGGNAIPFNESPGTISGIVKGLRQQVEYVRRCAPKSDILFIGPSDMMRMVDGRWESYPMVGYMDRLLTRMAKEENIAYFSLYRWMGGDGSMEHWQEIGLAGSDGVHFTRSGARKAGKAVAEWILEGEE